MAKKWPLAAAWRLPLPDREPDRRSPAQRVRDEGERYDRYWGPTHDAMNQEEQFLDGDRYASDHGAHNRDRRLIQIRGQEISDTVRHRMAQATARPRNAEPRAIGRDDDEAGEVMTSLVELELSNPWKGFEDCYEEALISALEKRLGAVWMDWDPDYGQFGEIFYSFQDPRSLTWDPGYDPHHPKCEWLIRKKRLHVETARAMYGAKWLEPDRNSGAGSSRRPMMGYDGHAMQPSVVDDEKLELWECWWKNDPSTKDEIKFDRLAPNRRYLTCTSGCGWRSDPQVGLPIRVRPDGRDPRWPTGCPTCGGTLERIDALDITEATLQFARGRRLTAIAPFCSNPKGKDDEVYDGAWPIPTARSFPGFFITADVRPGRPVGSSDTTRMWDQQVASDQLVTAAVQSVLEHRNYWELPRVGYVDYRNQPFQFRDDQFNVMYRDDSKAQFGPLNVELHNGTGVDPAFSTVYGVTQGKLTQYRGVGDIGFTPQNSKDIAASTFEQMVQQGEVQGEHFNRRKNRQLGKFYGVVSDYIAATYTPQRIARLNLDGAEFLARVFGADFSGFDFTITDSAPFTGVEKAKAESAQMLIQAAQAMPEMWDILAELQGHPPSVIRKIEKRMEELRMRAEEAQTVEDEGMPPEMAADDMDPGMVPGFESPNGAGMIQ